MRQRITFIHKPEDAIDPKSIAVTPDSLALSGLKAAREDRVTFGFDELPPEISLVLKQSHELHIRYVKGISYESIAPLVSRASPGLHVYYTPQRSSNNSALLCPLLHKTFSFKSEQLCRSPEESFTSLPTQRFHHSTAYEYYLPQTHYNEVALGDYLDQLCPQSDKTCRSRVEALREAEYVDLDYDTISHTMTMTAFWSSRTWDLSISTSSPKDRLEVGILSNEKPIEPSDLHLAGFLTVIGEDTTPSPTLFSFPARHHPLPSSPSSSFSAAFLHPTGLHPTLHLRLSSTHPQPPEGHTCSLHTHLTLPRVLFADKYQLSDPLFLASHNLSQIHHITQPVDLEAPEYAVTLWGSSLLLELAPPVTLSSAAEDMRSWTAEIPLHLRYLPPTPSGHSPVSIPWPVVFWACTADEGSKFSINPFDRVNLGYDGLFGPRTMFYHVSPENRHEEGGAGASGRRDGYAEIEVPVLKDGYAEWIEGVTAAAILLGFMWVMWKLFLVWKTDGYGRQGSSVDSKGGKKRE